MSKRVLILLAAGLLCIVGAFFLFRHELMNEPVIIDEEPEETEEPEEPVKKKEPVIQQPYEAAGGVTD